MADILKQAWWVLLLRGIAALLFAMLLLFAPGITLATGALSFAVLFGIYALADGIATAAGAIMRREGQWLLLLLFGIVGILAGVIALANPLLFSAVTVRLVIFIVAFKMLAGGVVEVISAWRLRQEIDDEWLLMLNGIFAVLFGVILLVRPITGLEVLILLVAFYALIAGVLQIVLAFKVRGWSKKIEAVQPAITAN